MIINKEYPATHSMSTSWYIVDEEGNVGIMNFNENGPVPYGIGENDSSYLALGLYDDYHNKTNDDIKLTDVQIQEMLTNTINNDELDWVFDEVIKIDTTKEERFHELMENEDVNLRICLSKDSGLYIVNFSRCNSSKRTADGTCIKVRSTFRKLISEKIISGIYELKELDTDDHWEDGKPIYEKRFDECPYYVYLQSYWPDFLQKRVHIPKHPVKIEQVNDNLLKKMYHVPVKFSSQEFIQIAEWFRSRVLSNEYAELDGIEYALLPLCDGRKAWICADKDAPQDLPYGYIIEEDLMNQLVQDNKAILK